MKMMIETVGASLNEVRAWMVGTDTADRSGQRGITKTPRYNRHSACDKSSPDR